MPTAPGTEAGDRPIKPNLLFAIVGLGVVMASLDQTINASALPTIDQALHTKAIWAAWTLTTYQLGMVVALPIAGRVGDLFGRRRVYLVCLSIFTFASLMCGLSQGINELIVFRFIQALGGGGLVPSAVGFITRYYGRNRDRAVGLLGAVAPIGLICGPVLGGIIIKFWSWRGIYLINPPIGALVFLLTVKFVPNPAPVPGKKIDGRGIATLVGTLLPIMFAITELGDGVSFGSSRFLVPACVAVGMLVTFVHHAKVADAPIVPLRFLIRGEFARLNIINFLYGGTAMGVSALMAYYAETRYRFAPLEASTVLTARAIGSILTSSSAALLIRRIGFRRPMILGFSLGTAGMLWLSHGPVGVSTYMWIAIGGVIMGTGGGMQAPATNNAMLHKVTEDAGLVSGLRGMLRQSGAICCISITTAIASRSADPGAALGHVFLVLGIIVAAIAIPLTCSIKDHRGRW